MLAKDKKYIIISRKNITRLEEKVGEYLDYGFKCQGGVFQKSSSIYLQAMIKEKTDD